MANIRKRGDKWQVQVRRLGFTNRSRSFNRHEEAKAWTRAQELAMDRLEAGVYQPVICALSSILREYLAKVTPAKKSHLSEARRLNRLLKDPISSYRVCDLSPEVLAKFRDRRLEQGLRASGDAGPHFWMNAMLAVKVRKQTIQLLFCWMANGLTSMVGQLLCYAVNERHDSWFR